MNCKPHLLPNFMNSLLTKKIFPQKINKLAVLGLVVCSTLTTSFVKPESSYGSSILSKSNDIVPVQPQLIAQSGRSFPHFLRRLAIRETGKPNPPSNIENRLGFIGKFQFGEAKLVDLKYYRSSPNPIYRPWISSNPSRNLWKNRWTGKREINSKSDFLRNKNGVQEYAMAEALALDCRYINSALQGRSVKQYLGRRINGVRVTTSGVLAAAHLTGAQATAKLLLSNGRNASRDENGTSNLTYLKEFAGYQIPAPYAGSCR